MSVFISASLCLLSGYTGVLGFFVGFFFGQITLSIMFFSLQIHLQVEKTLIEISLKLSIFVLLIARLYSSTGVHYM